MAEKPHTPEPSTSPSGDSRTSSDPAALYATIALSEAITWALLLSGMALKYSGITEAFMPGAGAVHGFVFLTFCVITVLVWINNRWSFGRGIAGLACSIVPFSTIPFERSARKAGLLEGGWRFQEGSGEQPTTLPEKALAMAVRRPILTAVILLAALMIVFAVLLSLGSPLEWFRD